MKLAAVVIPIYKETLQPLEIRAVEQVLAVLHEHDLIFACSTDLKLDVYLEIFDRFQKIPIVERFNSLFFESISGYNRLLTGTDFYQRFRKYQYILIHQTDAYVFKDELEYWCKRGYDYIGAPWFENYNKADANSKFLGVGNGGFSLRKVQSHLRVLHSFSYLTPVADLWKQFKQNVSRASLKQLIKNLTIQNNTYSRFNNFADQEDFFWGSVVPKKFKWFKIPDVHTALKFSMEVNAPLLYKLNNNSLPFGCHAWEKYTPEFWAEFVK